jgi:hypothetical protein
VTATLSDNLQHVLGNGARISSIGSVGVVATDTDGDTTTDRHQRAGRRSGGESGTCVDGD